MLNVLKFETRVYVLRFSLQTRIRAFNGPTVSSIRLHVKDLRCLKED